ncbi:MAG: hypothetical protein GX242_06260 [Clostridiales bacterium]|nr:hypothetical protein [Clostridiales bacterium]
MEQASVLGLKNVKFLNINAVYLPKYIKPNAITQIYLNFSNPLPQNRTENTRLTSPRYIKMYKEFLAKCGKVYQKTDDAGFFEYSLEQFSKHGFILEKISLNLHSSNEQDNILTEHEDKFSKKGLPIYKLEAIIKG